MVRNHEAMMTNEQTPATTKPDAVAGHVAMEQAIPRPTARRRWRLGLLALLVLCCGGYWMFGRSSKQQEAAAAPTAKPPHQGVPVIVAAARQGEMPVYLTGLGSVTAFNTVTVRSRVDGELISVAFQEGQFVHEGDLLAEIDPRPFEAQLTQAQGQLARDEALLKDAKINLERYRELVGKELVPRQQFDNQTALVNQYEGVIKLDQGVIENAQLQLSFCRITAPINGRVGLRLIDAGNMVHATDSNGLLVITQVEPIAVLFTLPEDNLPSVLSKLRTGEQLVVEAYDRTGQKKISEGSLLTVDNQIDRSTGTTRLKAVFQNQDDGLFPNQFVNVRLLLDVKSEAIIVPAAAIQRGPQGTFVYVVKADHTVEARPVTVGPTAGTDASIDAGLSVAEQVVVDGVDKLRPGSPVQVHTAEEAETSSGRPRA
jgi:multidrug efflux system membrane fusion protein